MINSRKVDDLHPRVAKLCHQFIDQCQAAGIDIIITSTYRDNETQAALYARGRTRPGKKLTAAKPGESYHNYRMAFDWVPITDGKLQYENAPLIKHCGEIAEKVGLEWAGRWKHNPERVHCQFTGGLSLADLQAGKHL